MQELFSESSAHGSLAMDAFGTMNDKADSDGSDDFNNDFSSYAAPEDMLGDDSDTLPSPFADPSCNQSSPGGENSSSSSGVKRTRDIKSAMKRRVRQKTRMGQTNDEICSTLQELKQALAAPPPPPPPPPCDPHVVLWHRLEAMTITTDQKLSVGTYLATKERKDLRGFLCASSETTFQTWVFKFLSGDI